MVEFYPCTRSDLNNANFPLNHDCILKVVYIHGSPLNFSFFTCRSQDSGALSLILLKVPLVLKVIIIPVEDFDL